MATEYLPLVLRYTRIILTLELILGGQARLTSTLTPSLHRRVMSKAEGTRKYLPLIPIKNPRQHTQFVGFLMCAAAALLCSQQTRLVGGVLSLSLTLMGVYSQWRMQTPYWLPSVNSVLAGTVIWGEVVR